VRRLLALYPDVKCKILYQRDYMNLLLKYGLEEPSQGMPAGDLDIELDPGTSLFGVPIAG
jgi:hypothetical protein